MNGSGPTSQELALRASSGLMMNRGIAELEKGRLDEACATILQAARIDAGYFAPWFHIGLAKKRQREWRLALSAFSKAWDRMPPNISAEIYAAIVWNIGIAATIMGDARRADEAWDRLGYTRTPAGTNDGRIWSGLIWVAEDGITMALAEQVNPAVARVVQAPSEKGALQVGAMVVHDAQRLGTRSHEGIDLSVFEVLAALSPGFPAG